MLQNSRICFAESPKRLSKFRNNASMYGTVRDCEFRPNSQLVPTEDNHTSQRNHRTEICTLLFCQHGFHVVVQLSWGRLKTRDMTSRDRQGLTSRDRTSQDQVTRTHIALNRKQKFSFIVKIFKFFCYTINLLFMMWA